MASSLTIPQRTLGNEKSPEVEYCTTGKPHIAVWDPNDGTTWCPRCGNELPYENFERNIGEEISANFPNAKFVKGRSLGSDPNRTAYELAGIAWGKDKNDIAKMQKKGMIEEANDPETQQEVLRKNNMMDPAGKNHVSRTELRDKTMSGILLDDEIKERVTRVLEAMGVSLASRGGIELGDKLTEQALIELRSIEKKLCLQTPANAKKIFDEIGNMTLAMRVVFIAFDKKFPRELLMRRTERFIKK